MATSSASRAERDSVAASSANLEAAQAETLDPTCSDPFSRFSGDFLGPVLLLAVSKRVRFDGGNSAVSNEESLQKLIETALNEPLPSESACFGMPEAPAAMTSSLISFRHALVCKRWLRVARSVHPAIIVPRRRFFSAKTLASLLSSPTLGFANLRHLHLGEFATDVVDRHLVRSICDGCGSSLTHLTVHLYDRRLDSSEQQTGGGEAVSSGCSAISSPHIADTFNSCTRLVNLALLLRDGVGEIPDSISCLQQLSRLSMTLGCDITELPAELCSLSLLKSFTLFSDSLETLPDSFHGLTSLEHLDLRIRPLTHLPSDIGQLQNLKRLSLSSLNGLDELPASFCQLPALSQLSLKECYFLASLPENFHELSSLERLHLGGLDALTAFPESFGQLPALQNLLISNCSRLNQLPDSLCASRSLHHLTVRSCVCLRSVPENVGEISSLQYLNLEFLDELTRVPDSLGQLAALKELNIVDCDNLRAFPPSVAAMESLTRLVLNKCDLYVLPEDIGQLSSLVSLTVTCSRLDRLPSSFKKLGKLAELILLQCYNLRVLPSSFSNLSSLETLLIYGGTSLQSLPQGFEHLPKLRRLELFNCGFRRLPVGFGKLANLEIFKVGTKKCYDRHGLCDNQWLDDSMDLFGSCSMSSLPRSLTLLTRLEELVIDGCNSLDDPPPVGMGNLSSLKVLKVKNCDQLTYLSSFLTPRMQALALQAGPACTSAALAEDCDPPFPCLKKLEISGCRRLEILPEGLQMLLKLEHFTLQGCPRIMLAVWSSFPSLPLFPLSVTTIAISNTFQNAKCLPASFLSLSHLRHLELRHLRLDEQLIAPSAVTDTPARAHASLRLLSSLAHLRILDSDLPALPSNLDGLRELKVLMLVKCHHLSSLPPALCNLSKLEHLSLDFLPLTHLPDNLGQLTALRKLTLQSCKALQGLPSTLTLPSSLRLMTVANCPGISSLPDSISSLSLLTSLELRSLHGLYLLPSSLALLPSLVKLSLQGCKWLRALPDSLGSLSCLREVDLGGCEQLNELPQSLQRRMNVIEVKGRWGSR